MPPSAADGPGGSVCEVPRSYWFLDFRRELLTLRKGTKYSTKDLLSGSMGSGRLTISIKRPEACMTDRFAVLSGHAFDGIPGLCLVIQSMSLKAKKVEIAGLDVGWHERIPLVPD